MDKSPLRQGEGSSAASAPNTPPLWQAQKAKGERDMASSLCCVSRQGSGTKAVQKPFMICVMLCVLGYLSIAWLGGGWSRLWSAPRDLLGQPVCSYGDLPGFWAQKANSTVGTWTLLNDQCQLQDLVSPILAETKLRKESSEDVGILILGDSADRNLAFDICLAAETPVQPFNINVTDGPKTCNRGEDWGTYKDVVNCNTCRLPGLRITKESIWGFFEGRTPEDRLGLPLERSREGLEVYKEEHGRYPDLVVLHSNYWDVAQIVLFREEDGWEHAYGPLMKKWLENADKAAKFLQAKSAEVGFGLAYRTVQYPQMEDCAGSGKAKDHQIGERYHVTYLNAAGRELARRYGMFLVDIELMFAKFWSTEHFLSDNHHLNQEANQQVLNLYLNLMRNKPASRQRLIGLEKSVAPGKSRKSLALEQKAKGEHRSGREQRS